MTHALVTVGSHAQKHTTDLNGFETVTITLDDGAVFRISLRSEDPNAIEVRMVDSKTSKFEMALIAQSGNSFLARAQ